MGRPAWEEARRAQHGREIKRRVQRNEQAVFELLLTGKCFKEIAEAAGITWRATKWHASNLYRKHQVHDRVQLMAKFIRRK